MHKKEANGDTSYSKCLVNQIRDPYFHHLAIVSSNEQNDARVSNIDVDGVYFKNYDPAVYQDPALLKAERMELIVEKSKIQKMEDGTYHPADLMAHKIRAHMEEENRKVLTFVKPDDEKLEMLFKHYEMIQSYQHAFEELS